MFKKIIFSLIILSMGAVTYANENSTVAETVISYLQDPSDEGLQNVMELSQNEESLTLVIEAIDEVNTELGLPLSSSKDINQLEPDVAKQVITFLAAVSRLDKEYTNYNSTNELIGTGRIITGAFIGAVLGYVAGNKFLLKNSRKNIDAASGAGVAISGGLAKSSGTLLGGGVGAVTGLLANEAELPSLDNISIVGQE